MWAQLCGKPTWCALKGGSGLGVGKTGNLILQGDNHENILHNYLALKKNIDPVVFLGQRERTLKATGDV